MTGIGELLAPMKCHTIAHTHDVNYPPRAEHLDVLTMDVACHVEGTGTRLQDRDERVLPEIQAQQPAAEYRLRETGDTEPMTKNRNRM